ncbi:hypothetical protein OUZ56_029913 [Daphnia magna]|uniref:Sister chromatid cohesion protein DCC1 n=1 Tax=Daphnia magna TaxID=35525 RepID=A0ABR0B877_9CRUS|nr:hypothetical protein OUZ56_029913 [Daphnia magna]
MPRAPAISRLCTIKDICDYHPLDMYTRNEKHFIRLHYHILCGASLLILNLESATAFCLEGKCEIITSSEDILSDDEVLFLLNDQSEVLYIRQIKKGNNASLLEFVGVVTNEPAAPAVTEENEAIQLIVIAAEPTLQLDQEIIGPLVGPVEEGAAESIQPEKLFSVADILKEGRIGVKGDTSEEIIARLNAVDFPSRRCSQKDLSYLIWTSGTWLMRNYEMRKNFPSSDEILKMAKSIVFYFPSAGSFNTETPWDMLYDPYTRKGSMESYMRGKSFRKLLSDKRTKRQCTTVMFPECDSYTAEEQMEAEEHMRLTHLDSYDTRNHNRNEMLRLIKITYQS